MRRRTDDLFALRRAEPRALLREGLPIALGATLWLGIVHGPLIAGSRLVGEAELGSLALVLQAWYVGNAVVGAVVLSSLPGLARSHAAGDGRAESVATTAVVAALAGSTGVAMGAGLVLGPPLRWMLGPAYGGAVEVLPAAVVLVGLTAAGSVLQTLLVVRGTVRALVPASLVALTALALTLALHPGDGIGVPVAGAALGLAAWNLSLAAGTLGHRALRGVRVVMAVLTPVAALACLWLT